MIPAINEINFPSYATLHQATASFAEMGERTISTQVRIDGDIVPDFTGWELSFKGERFILNTKDPQAAKDNSTRNSLVDLTFVSWIVNELKRYFFFEPTSIDSSTAIADKYVAPVNLTVEDFAVLFNKVLKYYFGDKVVFSLYMSGQGQYSTDRALVEINYTYIWDVLVKFFEIYGVRWRIEYDESDDVYTIKAGWPTTDIDINDHDFEYGYKGGLVRFERQVQDVDIHNILLGRGGEKNIPYRYFKRVDPQNPDWAADPDAIPELANIYFDRLRDINFRWYVRGWMQNPNHDTSWEEDGYTYPSYTISSDSPYYFAYEKGRTDEKFNPVEYVRDLPSIEDYGERWGALDDNDDIFPTIQGVTRNPLGRIDETVAVSEIVTDDISAMAQNSAVEKSINRLSVSLNGETRTEFDLQSEEFTIPSSSTGNITYVPFGTDNTYPGLVRFDTDNSTVVAVSDGIEYPIDAIPAGTYRLKLHMVIARSGMATSATGTFGIENIILKTSTQETDAWKPTFDIWVKNIWGTEKQEGETDVQYAERVWLPILGDRVGNEAKIVFSTGFMSVSEDYEFPIVSYPVHDTSKSINGVPSEWRITLRKSDAEFDATGLYIPNASTGGKPVAGDKFFFIGIDMPHRYVTLAEEDLNTYKSAQLDTESAISPTWIMNLDKVRVHSLEDEEYGRTLADRLAAGGKVWIKDKRFTPGERLQLYVQSITYTWNEPTDESPYIVPDIEVVLSDKVVAVDSVVQRIQNDVSSIKNQYARISDVEAVVRSVAEPIFLKKTGESDSSDSPTQFSSKVTSKGFRQGGVGGSGWGIYRDNTSVWAEAEAEAETRTRGLLRAVAEEKNTEGDTVFEADRIVVRKELQVNSLVINQISYLGGKEIISAAKIEVSKVIETDNGYVCYFDQRRNSVANNFVVNDIAMGQVFDPYNIEQRYYKALVTAVDIDSITISKTQKVGSGAPRVGDVIVQYGNTTQSGRQYVIVRDVVGGGYERMLSGLNSLNADGDEYYFAGRESSGTGPRWFVGSHEQNGDYAEYENGVLTIKANVVFKAGQTIPGLSDLETQIDNLEYLHDALPLSSTIVDGGLILSTVIALRDSNEDIKSGINGDPALSNIAAWYGGPMADKQASPTPASYAKSLFRFDGSGYLAGGNIYWNDQGYGGIPGISWDGSNVIISSDVKFRSTSDSDLVGLVDAVKNFSDWFEEVNYGTDASPVWALRLKKHGNLDRHFVTNGDQIIISGTPQGGGGGGIASNLYDLLDVYGHDVETVKRADGTNRRNGDLLAFNSTLGMWVALDQASVTTDLSDYYTKSQTNTQISSAISALNLGAASTYGIGSVTSGNTGLVTGGAVYSYVDGRVNDLLNGAPAAYDTLKEIADYIASDTSATAAILADLANKVNTSDLKALTFQAGSFSAGSYSPTTAKTINVPTTLDHISDGSSRKLSDYKTIASLKSKGSASLPVYFDASGNAQTITDLDILSQTNGYVKANRFYLNSSVYFYIETVNGTPCVKLNAPFITAGDQIVISGTPGGGGGGGGATTLAGLDDTSISNPQSGQMLSWNGTKWVNTNAPTGSITSVSLAAGATNGTLHLVVNGTAQSDVAVTGLKALAYKDSLAFSEITGTASASQIPNLSWSKITSDKPTTLSGYGIADALLVFNAKAASQTWGNQTGTFITGANDSTGGSIAFRRDNPVEGQMSMVIDGTVYVKEGNNRVLDTGDVGSTVASQTSLANYLPLTGGTLEKNDGNILNINSTSTAGHNYMYFKVGGTSKASVGYYSGLAYVANETTYARIGVNDSGTPQYWSSQRSSTAQTLLHTGNYASFLNSVYHPYGGGNIAFQTSTLAASGQVTITGNWSSGTAGLVVANNTSDSIPWLINSLAPNMPVGGFGGGIIFGKADSAYNTGVLSFYYAGAESTSNYVGIGLYNHDNLLKVYGTGVTEVQSLKIGSATITWNSNGYLHIDKPIVTAGDQIVISGTPGGGGGGGATTLAGLDDVAITSVADGQLLQYNGSKWVNVAASSVGGVTSVAGRTGAITLTTSDITNIETWISGKGYITSYTDTKNTTGADNTTSKIFLVGPTAQTTSNGSARTYSNSNCYASGGYLYSGGSQVLTSHQTLYNLVINNSAGTAQITYKPGTSGTYALTLTKAMVGLGNVENTALSTWAGASSITTLGTITTGVWHGSAIGNSYLANSSITINGSSTSLGGSFSTASITAGTAGQSGASTGVSFSIPYVTMNKYGIVTAYGTHTHTISASDLTTTIGSKTYAAYHSAGYVKKDGDTMSGNLTIVGMTTSGTITSTVATGTAPLSVTSTTVVSNLNADLLDGQHGSYYAAASSVSTLQGYFTHGSAKAARSLASLGADSGYWYDTEYPIIAQWDDLTHVRLKCTNAAGTVSYDVRVSAADKFVTSRTLWGQSFDGTADVTGAMSSVTNIDSLLYFNTTNSRVGVGVSSPSYAFHCAGDICTNTYLRINAWSGYGSGSAAFWYNGNTSTLALDKGLSVTGTFVSTGDQVVSSDLTLKENLTPVTYSVSDIANARAVEFDWKDGRGHSMGSIAQDWLGIAPALVHGEEGNMSLAYGQLALVNTILLARQSESHEERIKELEARVSELEMENKRLRMN